MNTSPFPHRTRAVAPGRTRLICIDTPSVHERCWSWTAASQCASRTTCLSAKKQWISAHPPCVIVHRNRLRCSGCVSCAEGKHGYYLAGTDCALSPDSTSGTVYLSVKKQRVSVRPSGVTTWYRECIRANYGAAVRKYLMFRYRYVCAISTIDT